MKRIHHCLILVLMLLLCIGLFSTDVHAATIASGTTGSSGTWTLSDDGTLTVSGSGAISRVEEWSGLKIVRVVIEEGFTEIQSYAFSNLASLRTVTIGEGVKDLGTWAFSQNPALESVTLPDSVRYISAYAFQNCSALKTVNMPADLEKAETTAFEGCDARDVFWGTVGGARWSITRDEHTMIVWGGDIGNYDATGNRFSPLHYYNDLFDRVVIGEGVTHIGDEAFWSCDMVSVEIQGPVTGIGGGAFRHCSNLKKINLPDTLTGIGSYAFQNCSSLTELVLPESIISVSSYAFQDCTSLRKINWPESLTSIGDHIFMGCTDLNTYYGYTGSAKWTIDKKTQTLTLWGGGTGSYSASANDFSPFHYYNEFFDHVIVGEDVTGLGRQVFWDCDMETIELWDGLTYIAQEAFQHCSNLKEIKLPDSVTDIGNNAFFNCSALESINCPPDLNSCGSDAFYGCSSLKRYFGVEKGAHWVVDRTERTLTIWGGGIGGYNVSSNSYSPFYRFNEDVDHIIIGEGVTNIGRQALWECDMETIQLSEDVTSIAWEAFQHCPNLKEITLSENIESLGNGAFWNCPSLEKVIITSEYTKINGSFVQCPKLETAGPIGGDYNIQYPWTDKIPEGAFMDLEGLKSVTIAQGITEVGPKAFYGCTSLVDVRIPDSVETLGYSCFYGCSTLAELPIAGGVESLGNYCFAGCTALTEITIPAAVEEMGTSCFSGCTGLKKVTFTDSLTEISAETFYECSGLTEIHWGNSIEKIGSNAFASTGLITLELPDTLVELDSHAFAYCKSLTTVRMQDSVTTAGDYVFCDCSALTTVDLSDALTSIVAMFHGCSSLETVEIPDSVTKIDEAFRYCVGLKQIVLPESVACISKYTFQDCRELSLVVITGSDTLVTDDPFGSCPKLTTAGPIGGDYHIQYAWNEKIPAEAFWRSHLEKVVIGNGITQIGSRAFCDSLKLQTVEFLSDVAVIDGGAFASCVALESITLPDSLTKLGMSVFSGCKKLKAIVLPDSLTTLGGYAFADCSALSSVVIPRSVTTVESGCFRNCQRLTTAGPIGGGYAIEFGWIENIPDYVFQETQIKNVTLPDGLVSIGQYAFSCCQIKTVDFPGTLKTIGEGAFSGCELKELVLPDGLTTLGRGAFGGYGYTSNAFKSLVIPDSVTEVGDACFQDCGKLKTVQWGTGAAVIPDACFSGCAALTDVILPQQVTKIGERCFYDCIKLKSIEIPAAVTEIGEEAFGYCTALKEITFLGEAPAISGKIFNDVTATANYPGCSSGWTEKFRNRLGGSIQWVPYGDSHTPVEIPAVEPTCTAYGTTAGTMCQKCEMILTEPVLIPKLDHSYEATVIAPTCTEKGYTLHTCTGCGNSYQSDVTSKVDHVYESKVVAPTCAEQGYTLHTCIGCGKSYQSDRVATLEHTYESVVVEPTCVERGYTLHTCTGCGQNYKDHYNYDYKDHQYESEVITEVTCTEYGTICYTCTVCQYSYEDSIPSEGHDDVKIVQDATCTSLGFIKYECTRCGRTAIGSYIPVKSHTYGEWIVMEEATCTTDGVRYRECTECGTTQEEIFEAIGHDYDEVVTHPTCTEQGYTTYTCTVCGDSYVGNYKPVGDHRYISETYVPTCTEQGYTSHCCFVCGYHYNDAYQDALGHTEEIDAAVAPTCTATGLTEGRHCSVCGEILTAQKTVEATGHNYVKGTCTNCGDKTSYIAAPKIKGGNKASNGKPSLSWNKVDGAVKYVVYRATSKNGTYKATKTTTSTSYTNTTAVAGKLYYYYVVAVDANGVEADRSNIVSRTCDLAQPVITVSNRASDGAITIKWEKVEGAAKYEVYRATSKNGTYTRITTTSGTSITNTKTEAGKTYYYKVRAICDKEAAASAYSEVKSCTRDLARPKAKVSLKSKKPYVSWDKIEGATKYQVYRATSKNGTYKLVSTATNRNYKDSKATKNKTYYYKVVAVCKTSAGNSAYSGVVSIKSK